MITSLTNRAIVFFVGLPILVVGCAAQGPKYPEVIQQKVPVAEEQARIVFLRPNSRYDDYSASKAAIGVNDQKLGGLAYGGFLIADIAAGAVAVMASAMNPLKNPLVGSCKLQLQVPPGSTVYFDVRPRTASIVAGAIGSSAGVATMGNTETVYGIDEVGKAIIESGAQDAAAGAAGDVIVSGVESAGKGCGGHFRLALLDPQTALTQLQNLSSSH